MAWQNPKTDWVVNPKNPIPEDFNRIEGNIEFLKGDIETKKGAIVDAINDMNQPAQLTDTHAQLASKIRDISKDATAAVGDVEKGKTFYSGGQKKTGTLEFTGTASEADVLAGKTFYNTALKTKRTGTMPNRGAVVITPSTANQAIVAGYHNGQGYVRGDANLIAANIPVGKTIFGVTGSYSVISKIQRGNATIGADPNYINIPIETVDINKAIVIVRPYYATAGGATLYVSVTRALGYLLNNNTLRLERYSTGNYRQTKVFWEVVTFKDIKSLQKGQVVSTTGDTDISISSVDLNKSLIFFSLKTQSSRNDATSNVAGASLTNSTTLTVSHLFGAETVIQWYVVEFY